MPDLKRCIAFGVLCGLAVCVLLMIAISVLMVYVDVPNFLISVFSVVILMLSCYVSSYISTQLYRRKGLLQGVICGIAVLFPALILFLFSNGFAFTEMLPVKVIACTLSGAIGGIKGINTKKTKAPKWHKRR